MAFEAIKWLSLDPLAPWTNPVGGSGTWRPLLPYVYALDGDLPAAVRHLLSAGVYAALCLGVLVWLRRRYEMLPASLGAAWFAVHGAHIAVGGWVGGRADLLMGCAAVAALIAWDREKVGAAAAAVGVAVLFKETALLLPLALFVLRPDRRAWVPGVVAATAFATSLTVQQVDAGYIPSVDAWIRAAPLWPLFALEAAAPTFRPLVALRGVDIAGLVAATGFATWAAMELRTSTPVRRATLAAAIAVLPVLHVLPNDGGQWYLLLPTIPLAVLWAELGGRSPRVVSAAVCVLLVVSLSWGSGWADASRTVDRMIREADPDHPPPRQDPRDWPHVGPSFCCGLPYQLFADPRASRGSDPRS